jgi:hypothetical protein
LKEQIMDRNAAGMMFPPYEFHVERGKIREFARATLSQHPAYLKEERPVSPPTFLTTMFFWEEDAPGSNPWHLVHLDPKRGMHAEQEYVFHGPPPRAGTVLECRSRIESVFHKEGRRGGRLTFAVMVTEFRDRSTGALVAEARMTGVETEKAPEAGQ